jgi:DNA-binding SARP family transcriptional activator
VAGVIIVAATGTFSDDASEPSLRIFLPTAAPAMTVTLLGGFGLEVDGRAVELSLTTQRLVALLAIGGRSSRSKLAGVLWPDAPEKRAAACLRSGIWRVNREADGLIDANRFTLDLGADVAVDVRTFVRLATDQLRSTSSTPARDVTGAIGHSEDLLPDWDDEWILADRERLRQLRLHLLEEQAERLTRTRSYALALDAALAAVAADPLRESAHRAIMRIHLAEGNASEARRAYQTCRARLLKDLGVEPSEITTRMVRAAAGG